MDQLNDTTLVARWLSQQYAYGIDCDETFSPVDRILLALATSKDWNLRKMDVKKCIYPWRVGCSEIYMYVSTDRPSESRSSALRQ